MFQEITEVMKTSSAPEVKLDELDFNVKVRRESRFDKDLSDAENYLLYCVDEVTECAIVSDERRPIQQAVTELFKAKRSFRKLYMERKETCSTSLQNKWSEKALHLQDLVNKATLKAERALDRLLQCDSADKSNRRSMVSVNYNLPVKIEVFNGDPLLFPAWETAFTALVDTQTTSAAHKLNLLQQFLSGEPRSVVDGFFLLPVGRSVPGSKNQTKRKVWKQQFGQQFLSQ